MPPILCLDFGTSSIRAVVRDDLSNRRVLPIGQITPRQSIDGASIPSAFCIDADLQTVRFGQHAQEAILGNKKLAFAVTSPKRWLAEPTLLSQPVLPELEVTRRDILTGLMAYALFAAGETGLWTVPSELDEADIRIAHPVWPSSIKQDADRALGQIAWMAVNMAAAGDWGVTTTEVLCSWTTPEPSESHPELHIDIDTLEPIASAVELLPNIGNERRVCMVVDVGAGTTDVGIFLHLSPDKQTTKCDQLIPAGPANSVFKAGDDIDRVLLQLIRDKNPRTFDENKSRINSEIRFQKESLFKNGNSQIAGINLTLETLENSDGICQVVTSIRQGVEKCISDAYSKIHSFTTTAGLAKEIVVVMAGGGAEIKFLREALGKPFSINGSLYTFKILKPNQPKLNMHGAGYERMAVGLGAAHEGYEDVVHEHAQLLRVSSLGAPKQIVSRWS